MDMKTRVSAPIEDFYIEPGTTMDLTAKAYNNSGKVIKYYWVHFIAYNTVGDVIYQTTEKWTGPVNPGEVLSFTKRGTKGFMYWKVDFSECGKLEIANIKLEYTDGTIESGPYGYSTTEIK